MNTTTIRSTLVVTLTAEETALWTRGDSREDARWRLTIKRPTRAERLARGIAGHVIVDHEGRFLEDCVGNVRRVNPATIETRCRARDVWLPALPAHWAQGLEAQYAMGPTALTDALDVQAWLAEAVARPGADLDPTTESGREVVDAANRRLLGKATR